MARYGLCRKQNLTIDKLYFAASITVNVHLDEVGDAAGECKVWYENRAGVSDTKVVMMQFEPCYGKENEII